MHPLIVGTKYGMLTLVAVDHAAAKKTGCRWICLCDCGKTVSIFTANLKRRNNPSCGCNKGRACRDCNITHGMTWTPTHNVWITMRQRCSNPKRHDWERYGGRGIKVCERWQTFANFLADMGEKPPGLSIERVNNDKGYEPSNCKWADAKTQANNRHPRRTYCGKPLPGRAPYNYAT